MTIRALKRLEEEELNLVYIMIGSDHQRTKGLWIYALNNDKLRYQNSNLHYLNPIVFR